jgi:hypothetical protein
VARPPGGPPITARIAEDTLHEEPERLDSVTKPEVAKLQDYLRRKFANASIRIVALKNGDSAEVYIGEESIGVISDDKEDGDDSFVFRMAILDIDLEEEA